MKLSHKEQKEKFYELADILQQIGKDYHQIFTNETSLDQINDILKKESEADKIQDILNLHYTTQKNVPYLALDRANLLRRLDDVMDTFAISAKLVEYLKPQLPEGFANEFTNMLEMIDQQSDLTAEAVRRIFDDFSKAKELTEQVEEFKDIIVNEGFTLEKKYFETLGADDWKQFHATTEILKRTAKIANSMRNVGELLVYMITKYLD